MIEAMLRGETGEVEEEEVEAARASVYRSRKNLATDKATLQYNRIKRENKQEREGKEGETYPALGKATNFCQNFSRIAKNSSIVEAT
jgi:hypothetical protein